MSSAVPTLVGLLQRVANLWAQAEPLGQLRRDDAVCVHHAADVLRPPVTNATPRRALKRRLASPQVAQHERHHRQTREVHVVHIGLERDVVAEVSRV
jgi:hypothetical protein